MRISFEPGDGSFEVSLEGDEPLPAEWNIQGVVVIRDHKVIKWYDEVLA